MSTVDEIIDRNIFRNVMFDMVPEGASNILEVGCNEGELLLKLGRDKGCTNLWGFEKSDACEEALDSVWHPGGISEYIIGDIEDSRDHAQLAATMGFEKCPPFDYVLMHDVLEHLYDPWWVLSQLRKHCSSAAQFIVCVPNISGWKMIQQVLHGQFVYGCPGGLMNEDHVRWFSPLSLADTGRIAGLDVVGFNYLTDATLEGREHASRELAPGIVEIPPREFSEGWPIKIKITFSDLAAADRLREVCMGTKVMMVFRNTDAPISDERVGVNTLHSRRQQVG